MKLSEFIRKNDAAIIAEWEAFASTCPPAWQAKRSQLRNNITGLLKFIADDLDRSQASAQQPKKLKCSAEEGSCETPAEEHAEQRFTIGFDTLEMISEFRAFRASVVNLWRPGESNSRRTVRGTYRF